MTHPFEKFLEDFVPIYKKKFIQLNKATWILETTGSQDAADLKADLDTELRIILSDPVNYQKLISWEGTLEDPLLKRELDILIRTFKPNQVAPALLEKMAQKEATLAKSFAKFRPHFEGKLFSENEIRDVLKKETDISIRKKVWEGSKEVGKILAPQILELVNVRNTAAKSLGYSDYFQMQLELQDIDENELLILLDDLFKKSENAYSQLVKEIEASQTKQFNVSPEELGPWAWSEPFCQEDPLDCTILDMLVEDVDIVSAGTRFYDQMGIDVRGILKRSDMYERSGKNQHAFCIDVDREGDVRTLNNVSSSIKWLETVLHEYGHAIYDIGVDRELPWSLREFPHIFTTEAMALLAGRQAYRMGSLLLLVPGKSRLLMQQAEKSLKRRQLIFSRWVLVMTEFERGLYRDPKQDLNGLWWTCVEKYQKVKKPKGREKFPDWAAKYHIGLAPVYYFSYLLGEMFASSIQEALRKETGSVEIATKKAGLFLQEKLFKPGNRLSWKELVKEVTGAPLTPDAWVEEFGKNSEFRD